MPYYIKDTKRDHTFDFRRLVLDGPKGPGGKKASSSHLARLFGGIPFYFLGFWAPIVFNIAIKHEKYMFFKGLLIRNSN